jgi:hypothetical protein
VVGIVIRAQFPLPADGCFRVDRGPSWMPAPMGGCAEGSHSLPSDGAGSRSCALSGTCSQAKDIDQLGNDNVGRKYLLGKAARFAGGVFVVAFDRA